MPRNVLALLLTTSCLSGMAMGQSASPVIAKSGSDKGGVAIQQNPTAGQPPVGNPQIVPPGDIPPVAPKVQETSVPAPVVIAPPASTNKEVPNRPVTAEEAARIALRLQPSIAVARDSVLAQQGITQQIRAGILPQVAIQGAYNHIEVLTSQATGASSVTSLTGAEGITATATLRQLVYDFNHTRDLIRQSVAQEQAASYNLTATQLNLVLSVKQAYYQVVENHHLVEVQEANVANRQSQLDLAIARLKSGLGLPSDVVTAETAKAEAILSLNQARANEGIARLNLAYTIGIDPRTPILVTETGEVPLATDDVNVLFQSGLKRRPEVLQAEALIRSATYGVNAAKTTNAPTISGNVNVASRGTEVFPQGNTFSIGAAIQFTPLDGGLTSGKVKQAKAGLDSARAQLASVQLTVQSDIAQAYLNLRTAERGVLLATSDVVNAEEGVRIATGRYRAGLGQFLDIINAQAFVVSARTNLVTNQALVEIYRAAVNRAIGAPFGTLR